MNRLNLGFFLYINIKIWKTQLYSYGADEQTSQIILCQASIIEFPFPYFDVLIYLTFICE